MGLSPMRSSLASNLPVFPPLGFLRSIVLRATGIWILLHAALLGLFGAISLEPPAILAVVALVVWLTTLYGRRASEHVFLANLGVPEWLLMIVAAIPPCLLELLLVVFA